MPAFGLPGVATTPRGARLAGLVMAAVVTIGVLGWRLAPERPDPGTFTISVLTERVGTGIETGSDVRSAGVRVGIVESVATAGPGRQRILLRLDKSRTADLTDALSLDFAPGNLFGISEIQLHGGSGGAPLADRAVVDLTAGARRARDATISTLLNSVGQLTNQVLTPQLISTLSKIAEDTRAFAPLLQAMMSVATAVADTQRLPSDYLLRQYADTLAQAPTTMRGLIDVLDAPFSNAYLRTPGKIDKFDASIAMIKDDLISAVVTLADTAHTHLGAYVGILSPLLTTLAATVPDPARSSADLTLLLQRLDAAFTETPDGPVLNLGVDLQGVPGLAVPLTAVLKLPAHQPTEEGPR